MERVLREILFELQKIRGAVNTLVQMRRAADTQNSKIAEDMLPVYPKAENAFGSVRYESNRETRGRSS